MEHERARSDSDFPFLLRLSDRFFAQYKNGTLNLNEFLEYQLKPLKVIEKSSLLSLRKEFVHEEIKPIISEEAKELVN